MHQSEASGLERMTGWPRGSSAGGSAGSASLAHTHTTLAIFFCAHTTPLITTGGPPLSALVQQPSSSPAPAATDSQLAQGSVISAAEVAARGSGTAESEDTYASATLGELWRSEKRVFFTGLMFLTRLPCPGYAGQDVGACWQQLTPPALLAVMQALKSLFTLLCALQVVRPSPCVSHAQHAALPFDRRGHWAVGGGLLFRCVCAAATRNCSGCVHVGNRSHHRLLPRRWSG